MYKKTVFLSIFLFMQICLGKTDSFFNLSLKNDGTVLIELENETGDYSYSELLRSEDGDSYIPIFEFTTGVHTFSDSYIPGSCYVLKVYFLNGSSVVSEPDCLKKTDYLKMVDTGLLGIFIILLISFILPFFFNPRVLSSDSIITDKIFKTVRGIIGEGSRDVEFILTETSVGNPLSDSLRLLTGTFFSYCDIGRDIKAEVHFFNKYHNGLSSDRIVIPQNCPRLDSIPAYSISSDIKNCEKPSLVFSFTGGSIESDFTLFQKSSQENMIGAGTTVSSSVANVLTGRPALLSIELFTVPQEIESLQKGEKFNPGAYLFLMACSFIIFSGAVILTIDSVFPFLHYLRFFTGGIK